MKKQIILIGGGGHCVSCIDVVESTGIFEIYGILDSAAKFNQQILNFKIIGTDEDIPRLVSRNFSFLVTIGFILDSNPRIKLYEYLTSIGADIGSIFSSRAIVSHYAKIGIGSIVMHHAVVNANAKVGNDVIINTGAVIEHGAIIGDHSHISTGAFVNGDCNIGCSVFIGSTSVITEGLSIADNVIVGAGSVVIKSINEPGVYVGNPARKLR